MSSPLAFVWFWPYDCELVNMVYGAYLEKPHYLYQMRAETTQKTLKMWRCFYDECDNRKKLYIYQKSAVVGWEALYHTIIRQAHTQPYIPTTYHYKSLFHSMITKISHKHLSTGQQDSLKMFLRLLFLEKKLGPGPLMFVAFVVNNFHAIFFDTSFTIKIEFTLKYFETISIETNN